MKNSRYIAATIIQQVLDGKSLNEVLSPLNLKALDKRDQGFVKAVSFGVCRQFYSLSAVLFGLLKKPFEVKDNDLQALLLVGIYQLAYMRVAPHAAISETVAAVQALKKDWARGLVNAVLRQFQREENSLKRACETYEEAMYEHPDWMIARFRAAWPAQFSEICQANNTQGALTLRINTQKISRDAYLLELKAQDLVASKTLYSPVGLVLERAIDVTDLPGFNEGLVSVQDESAQLAVDLLDLQAGQHILDACAAPGGKLAHMLEAMPTLASAIALDISPKRLESVKQNLTRLSLNAVCVAGDASAPQDWFDGKHFDRILLDAPCSATGVVRRHPDIKVLRMDEDIAALAHKQLQLLQALWPLLKIGGVLVYATCSILPDENFVVVEKFLSTQPGAKALEIDTPWGEACVVGKQILPSAAGLDGFYYARIQKLS